MSHYVLHLAFHTDIKDHLRTFSTALRSICNVCVLHTATLLYPVISIYNILTLFNHSLQKILLVTFPSVPQKSHLHPSGLPTFSLAWWTPVPLTRLLCVSSVHLQLLWECISSIWCLALALTAAVLDRSPCSVILGAQVSLDFPWSCISSNTYEVKLYSTLNHSTVLSHIIYPKLIWVGKVPHDSEIVCVHTF